MAGLVRDTCIGTEDVDRPEMIPCFLEAVCDGIFVRDVALDVEDVTARSFVLERLQVVGCDSAAGRCCDCC
jgi:hypothetical protein